MRRRRSVIVSSSPGASRRLHRPTLRLDAGKECFGGLVGRVLRDELAAERALEDGPAES